MPLKVVRNDITQMNTEVIVNTANDQPTVGTGCDSAVYKAAGYDELLAYREEKIGFVAEGEAFITPGFNLNAKYIIHAVSPLYMGGNQGEEEKLRSCYRKSLALAKENNVKSIAFPLISTGGFGYPKEDGMRIAVDEINEFLLTSDMLIYLVVFDAQSTELGKKIFPALDAYIDQNYVKEAHKAEYGEKCFSLEKSSNPEHEEHLSHTQMLVRKFKSEAQKRKGDKTSTFGARAKECPEPMPMMASEAMCDLQALDEECSETESSWDDEATTLELNKKLNERLAHKADTFSEYLLYLIEIKGMTNVEVYKRACLTKQYFHKVNKNKDFHPEKINALRLCVGAKLSLDETKDLLARAGYALSPADLTDIIFSFFIEHKHYDIIDIDIQLEEHGLPCIIS